MEWERADGNRITIAVRTSGSRNSDHDAVTKLQAGGWDFSPARSWTDPDDESERRCWADVAVLCFHDGWDLAEGWEFYVLSADQIEGFPAQRLTTSNLSANGYTPVGAAELGEAIDASMR